jgi:hypothetical protein
MNNTPATNKNWKNPNPNAKRTWDFGEYKVGDLRIMPKDGAPPVTEEEILRIQHYVHTYAVHTVNEQGEKKRFRTRRLPGNRLVIERVR